MEPTYLSKSCPREEDEAFVLTTFCPSDFYGEGHDPEGCKGKGSDCYQCWTRPFPGKEVK